MKWTGCIRVATLLCVFVLITGCARSSSNRNHRIEGQPKFVTGLPQDRAEAALAALSSSHDGRSLKIVVLDSQDVGAYCWPSGKVVLTRGLLEVVDDPQLIAAIAHEVGHLLADGHLPGRAALAGCQSSPDAETEADLVARALLRSRDLPDEALVGLLQKLAAHPQTTSACRGHLDRRVARLLQPH